MTPIPHWTEFKNKKVVVMGLGIHGGGLGVTQFFAKLGAKVTVTDMKTADDLKPSIAKLKKFASIRYVLGGHREEDFKNADLIVQNPGVRRESPYLKIAKKHGVPIHTEISLFFLWCMNPIIGVTGTKGKSTTTNLIREILETQYRVHMGGNIRIPILGFLEKAKKNDLILLELSSWQVESLKTVEKSPAVAVITNIEHDHLNTYDSFDDYAKAKKLIYAYQNPRDHLVLPKKLAYLKEEGVGKVHIFAYTKKLDAQLRAKGYKLVGKHMIENAACALSIAKIFQIDEVKAMRAIAKAKPLFGRLEVVRKMPKATWINDTCSTAPYSTAQSISAFPKERLVLIAGGTDKALPYEELARTINRNVRDLILLSGSATEKLKSHLRKDFIETKSLKDAIGAAHLLTRRGDTVLFSPAAASFELFKNEFDRGEKFVSLVKKLK